MNVVYVILIASTMAILGTVLGAFLGIIIKKPSEKLLGNIVGFASGLMLSVVAFDLIPEAVEWSLFGTLIFSLIGVLTLMVLESAIRTKYSKYNDHKKIAAMIALGLMFHNLPEGIIMGCGFFASGAIGFKMSLIIMIHDIPEGISFSAPLMAAREKRSKIILYALLTAVPTIIGAFIGVYIGNVSPNLIGFSIAVASGIMLYVITGEMLPEATKLWNGRTKTLSTLLGFALGIFLTNIF